MKNFNFIKHRKIFFAVVAIVLVVGIISFIFRGFNLDIDFTGGTTLQISMKSYLEKNGLDKITPELEDEVEELLESVDGIKVSSFQRAGDDGSQFIIKLTGVESITKIDYESPTKEATDAVTEKATESTDEGVTSAGESQEINSESDAENTSESSDESSSESASESGTETETETEKAQDSFNEVSQTLFNMIRDKYGLDDSDLISASLVGGTISGELRRSAIIASIIAVVIMLIYITIRFDFHSGLAAITCLVHDIFVMLVAYSLFAIPMNSTMIAALLTILGYSINATIIIFDRIRENKKKIGSSDFEEIVNVSINQTMKRSIFTTITTFVTITALYVLGVESIKQFALPIMVGIVAGFFSSVCLAGNLWNIYKRVINIGKKEDQEDTKNGKSKVKTNK